MVVYMAEYLEQVKNIQVGRKKKRDNGRRRKNPTLSLA